MKNLLKKIWDAEPVAVLTASATLVPLVAGGLVVFGAWHPTDIQQAYVNGIPAALAASVGLKLTRAKVTPLPPPPPER